MTLFRGTLLISVIALGLSAPAVAQPKADAGSGPTTGCRDRKRRRQRAHEGR